MLVPASDNGAAIKGGGYHTIISTNSTVTANCQGTGVNANSTCLRYNA